MEVENTSNIYNIIQQINQCDQALLDIETLKEKYTKDKEILSKDKHKIISKWKDSWFKGDF